MRCPSQTEAISTVGFLGECLPIDDGNAGIYLQQERFLRVSVFARESLTRETLEA